jgi:uncharacterized protein (UPF0248 family)
MIPIHELLSRIRWDSQFAKGEFVIGYYDRVEDCIMRVPLRQLAIDPSDHYACKIVDSDGEVHMVPFHRIREVYKDGVLLWRRHPPH